MARSSLAGLVTATYLATRGESAVEGKLGVAGAIRWFAPIQPYLTAAAIGLLAWEFVA